MVEILEEAFLPSCQLHVSAECPTHLRGSKDVLAKVLNQSEVIYDSNLQM
jgi:hypothetical protein